MRSRSLGALLVLLTMGVAGSAESQSQADDPIQALKDSLSRDQGSSLLQSVLGKGDGTGKKTDSKLNTPETVQSKSERAPSDKNKAKLQIIADGRILRQRGENPELRADDTVLIDLTSFDDVCNRNGNSTDGENNNNNNASGPVSGAGASASTDTLSKLSALTGGGGLGGLDALTGANNANGASSNSSADLSRCPPPNRLEKPKTDEEKSGREKFGKRILSGIRYKRMRCGVLELPGLPAVPVAGLTASEATKRLGAD